MSYIKAIPYVVAIVLLAAVGRFTYVAGYNAAERKWSDKYTMDLTQANSDLLEARKQLLAATNAQAEIEAAMLERMKQQAEYANNIIDDLRDGNVRLREQFRVKTCPSVSGSTGSTGGSDAASTGGLSEEAVGFLIREAGRADTLAEQLKAAQEVIKQDRIICGPSFH